ncbi:MAG: hypothetical protein HZA52_03550 [Planctomycetes bacterium]|nr:hypothetical protein [Planctomycetota bacterium]
MRNHLSTLTLLALLPLSACASSGASTADGDVSAQNASQPAGPAGGASAPAPKASLEKVGIVAPANYAAVALWPEQFAGGFSIVEVLPHGATVAEGDVIAKLDPRAYQDERHRMELELRSTEIRHEAVVERNKLDAAAAALAFEQSKASLERAKRSFEGYKKFELEFDKRQEDLSKRYEQANIEDQVDELDQLEKMYKADALVDATEDIVVKRAKRSLDTTKLGTDLSIDRRKYREDFEKKMSFAQREESLRAQEEGHARLEKQQALDAKSRADGELRSADSLNEQRERFAKLSRDGNLLELRAPRAGVLLHGSSKDFRPGRNAPRYERASSLATKTELFLVAEPEPALVTVDISDADLATAKTGARVAVQSLVDPSEKTQGTLSIDTYPRTASPSDATYDARVTLDAPLSGVVYGTRAKLAIEAGKVDG